MITQAKKQELITKHAKKFAGKNATRPILHGVHYAADGSAFVSNGHYGLCIKNVHGFTEPFTSHVVTGQPIQGTYPPFDKVFPKRFDNEVILTETVKTSQIKTAVKLTKTAYEIAKDFENTCQIVLENGVLFIEIKEPEIQYRAFIGNAENTENAKWKVNTEYLFNIFNLFKDAGTVELKMKMQNGAMPFVFSDERNEIDIILLPYEKPE